MEPQSVDCSMDLEEDGTRNHNNPNNNNINITINCNDNYTSGNTNNNNNINNNNCNINVLNRRTIGGVEEITNKLAVMSTQANVNSNFLSVPKLTKQFLISPPASPPVGWEPVTENSPCIDVQLISAIANLVPGKVHEIHPGSESQPGIYVEVCEEVQFDNGQQSGMKTCSRIPRTMSPGCS